ncbi:Pr6Pr family membrane protein [Kocuria rosea]|uniref:Pr6Pr family membrane protein n=1 Tax=Kocuria rosea TaxID=1275 RepID=UPI00203E2745|nr:Pr6Pr family membrane protein [Kocuria rosea]
MRTLLLPARALALIVAVWAVAAPTDCVAGTCRPGELFNYFTIHSAALLILAVLLAMLHTIRAGGQPPWLTTLRALATTYMMVSGAVFAAMVAHAERFGHSLSVPLSSTVLHFVLPVYALADFLMDPQRHRLRWATAWLALIFPALWGVYTMALLFPGSLRGRWVSRRGVVCAGPVRPHRPHHRARRRHQPTTHQGGTFWPRSPHTASEPTEQYV